jgi:phenylpyruvate tautomerase PptA (4-oxalocrotonate tautomerase family)
MPLVRIDIIEGRSAEQINLLADTIQQVMIKTFAAPELDRYQVIHEHKAGYIRALDTGLNYPRTDNIVIIQVTQQGRNTKQKKAMYKEMSKAMEKIGISPYDLIISVTKNTKADWSFGLGRAQFLDGDLIEKKTEKL